MNELFLQDPFKQAFIRAVKGGEGGQEAASLPVNPQEDPDDPLMTSPGQWQAFVTHLENDGLLDDRDVMDDIWQQVSKDAKAFQPQGTSRLRLSFSKWRDMLAERCPPDIDGPEKALIRVEQNIGYFADMVRGWDLPTMSREEVRSLLYILGKVQSQRAHLGSKLAKRCEEEGYGLMMGRMWQLLGGKDLDECLSKRVVGVVNNPFRWQFDHLEEVEKTIRSRRPRKIRFHPTRKSGPRGPLVSDSLYGVGQGFNGKFGVSVHVATCCHGKEGEAERDMVAVVVPSNAPYQVTRGLMYAYTAAREMGTAGRGPLKCLGKDWTNREESLYYYEFPTGSSLAHLLISGQLTGGSRVMLGEETYLFRYWSRELLWALAEVQQQSCHHLLNRRLDLTNVVVSGRGLKLRLANLRWGPQVSLFSGECDQALQARMRLLMREYGRMVEEMLGVSSHACWSGWFSNIGKVLPASALVHVPHYEAMGGVEVQEGDEVVVELDAHGRWYESCEVVDDEGDRSGRRPCVEVGWVHQASRQDHHSFRLCGRRPGKCRVICQYYEVEDPKRATLFVPIPVKVTLVNISARLKAILQCCQLGLAKGDVQFEGPLRHHLSQPPWTARLGKVWLSDLLKNEYFKEFDDAGLDRVMEEYEDLFRPEDDGGGAGPPS